MQYNEVTMLQLSATLIDQPVLSLRTGGEVAVAVRPIFNPNNLKIEGFYCVDAMDKKRQLILVAQDVREIIAKGFVVNDYEVLTEPEELVRLHEVLQINFELIGKPVFTVSKQKLGKVDDYAIDNQSLLVKKLYVSQSLLKSLNNGQLGIDRTQIVEITDRKIVVKDLLQPTKSAIPLGAAPAV